MYISIAPTGDILLHCKLCLPKCARKSSQAAKVVVEGVHILQLPLVIHSKDSSVLFFPPTQWFQMVKIRHKIGLLVLVLQTFHRNSQQNYIIILVFSD